MSKEVDQEVQKLTQLAHRAKTLAEELSDVAANAIKTAQHLSRAAKDAEGAALGDMLAGGE